MQTWAKQARAIDTPAKHTLYCGARKAGKTRAQLLCFFKMVVENWDTPIQGMIFDLEHPELGEVKRQSHEILGGRAFYTENRWRFRNGSQLLFRHAKNPKDCEKYLGFNQQFIGINEISKHPTPEIYDALAATLKTKGKVKPIMFSTTNPFGAGKGWLKRRFIDPAPYETLVERRIQLLDGSYEPSTYIAYFGSFLENPFVSRADQATVLESCKYDQAKHEAWVLGSWDTIYGNAVESVWDKKVHVIPRIKQIPTDWIADRTMDWGYKTPSAILHFVEVQSGERFPVGTLICINELITQDPVTREGMKYTPRQLCDEIKSQEEKMRQLNILSADHSIWGGAADSQIFQETSSDSSIADVMESYGISWEKADKRSGSRVIGKQLIIEKLANALEGKDAPGLYFTEDCPICIQQIPEIQNDDKNPEDTLKGGDDHAWDALRYKVFTPPSVKGESTLGMQTIF